MTWYARHLYAENDPGVLDALRADERLQGHIYVVDTLKSFERVEREPFAIMLGGPGEEPRTTYRDVVHRPAFPANGLIVVRELAERTSHACEWFGDDALDVALGGSMGIRLEPEDGEDVGTLRYAKNLAHVTGCTTCVFSTDFWGGDCDDARAFVYESGEETAYFRHEDGTVTQRSSRQPGRTRTIVGGDALTLCLLHFDVLLSSGHFLLHTRSFPWDQFRLG